MTTVSIPLAIVCATSIFGLPPSALDHLSFSVEQVSGRQIYDTAKRHELSAARVGALISSDNHILVPGPGVHAQAYLAMEVAKRLEIPGWSPAGQADHVAARYDVECASWEPR